jgi:hypothetical protein
MVGSKALIFMCFHAVLFGKPHEIRFETAQWKSQYLAPIRAFVHAGSQFEQAELDRLHRR